MGVANAASRLTGSLVPDATKYRDGQPVLLWCLPQPESVPRQFAGAVVIAPGASGAGVMLMEQICSFWITIAPVQTGVRQDRTVREPGD